MLCVNILTFPCLHTHILHYTCACVCVRKHIMIMFALSPNTCACVVARMMMTIIIIVVVVLQIFPLFLPLYIILTCMCERTLACAHASEYCDIFTSVCLKYICKEFAFVCMHLLIISLNNNFRVIKFN